MTLLMRCGGGSFTGRLFGSAILSSGAFAFDLDAKATSASSRSVLQLSSCGAAVLRSEFQNRFAGTCCTKFFVSHVSDLSSSKKSVIFFSFLLSSSWTFLVKFVSDKIFFKAVTILAAQHLDVRIMFLLNRARRPPVVNSLGCLNFSNARCRIRGMTRTSTNLCSKIQLPTAERSECGKLVEFRSLLFPVRNIVRRQCWRFGSRMTRWFHWWWQEYVCQTPGNLWNRL